MESVSWNDVQVFIKKLNEITGQQFRLPFETEWEYAARGGKKSTDKKYSGSDSLDCVAWYNMNSDGITHSVAMKEPNEIGIYDMTGNILEFCQDLSNSRDNFKASLRGGEILNLPEYLRVSFRDAFPIDDSYKTIGFRLALLP